MIAPINGIHHVTAISSDAQATFDFYTTILAFFNWVLPDQKPGAGSIDSMAFSVPLHSISFWKKRLKKHEIFFGETNRFGESVLNFSDASGLSVELVGQESLFDTRPWNQSDGPVDHAIRGFAGVSLIPNDFGRTADFLEKVLLFAPHQKPESDMARFSSGNSFVDVKIQPDSRLARQGNGSIHHVAFRVKDADHQARWREQLVKKKENVTPAVERFYFKSIY